MIELEHGELEDQIRSCYKANLPLFIWGTTGIGKSQQVKRMAKEFAGREKREYREWNKCSKAEKDEILQNPGKYFILIDVRLAEYDPSDIKGIPDLEKNGAVEWKPPLWVYAITKEQMKGVVFLDEANLAPPSVQTSFYQLILDREVGDCSVSDGVFLVSAGNRAEDRANVYEMNSPLYDRFVQVTLKVPSAGSQGDWTAWATENGIDERVVDFLSTPVGEDFLYTFEDNKDSKVFATPRSWEFTSQLIEGEKKKETIYRLMSSTIGEDVATNFIGFLDRRQQIDIEAVLKNPEKIREIEDKEVDTRYAVVTGISAEYKKRKDILPQLVEIAKYLDEGGQSEFGILLLRMAKNYNPNHFKNIRNTEGWSKLSTEASKYLL